MADTWLTPVDKISGIKNQPNIRCPDSFNIRNMAEYPAQPYLIYLNIATLVIKIISIGTVAGCIFRTVDNFKVDKAVLLLGNKGGFYELFCVFHHKVWDPHFAPGSVTQNII